MLNVTECDGCVGGGAENDSSFPLSLSSLFLIQREEEREKEDGSNI